MTTTHMGAVCPFCGCRVDAHAHIGKGMAVPTSGDLTLCMRCGQYGVFATSPVGMIIVKPDVEKAREIADNPEAQFIRAMLKFIHVGDR